jgi:hypothetical protein
MPTDYAANKALADSMNLTEAEQARVDEAKALAEYSSQALGFDRALPNAMSLKGLADVVRKRRYDYLTSVLKDDGVPTPEQNAILTKLDDKIKLLQEAESLQANELTEWKQQQLKDFGRLFPRWAWKEAGLGTINKIQALSDNDKIQALSDDDP